MPDRLAVNPRTAPPWPLRMIVWTLNVAFVVYAMSQLGLSLWNWLADLPWLTVLGLLLFAQPALNVMALRGGMGTIGAALALNVLAMGLYGIAYVFVSVDFQTLCQWGASFSVLNGLLIVPWHRFTTPGRCPSCNYNVYASRAANCPECGMRIER